MLAQHHRTLPQDLPETREHQIDHRQHHQADQRQRRAQHHEHDADEQQREQVRRDADDHGRNHRLQRGHVGQDVRNQLAGPVLLVKTQRQALQVLEELHAQIEQHAVDRVISQVVAGVEEERPDPVEQDHAGQQHIEQTQVRPAERLVDDDLQHQRHQQPETRADHVKHGGHGEHRLIRFYEAVQFFELMRVFGRHGTFQLSEAPPRSRISQINVRANFKGLKSALHLRYALVGKDQPVFRFFSVFLSPDGIAPVSATNRVTPFSAARETA
jgi:hypothetical protein